MNTPTNQPQAIGAMSDAFREFLDPQESLSEGLWQSFPILGYRGKQWSLRFKGQEYYFTGQLPNGQQVPMPYIDCVILRQTAWLTKTFYDGPFDPVASDGKRPDCSSRYGDVPDPDVPHPQAVSCNICPQNVFKLTPEGRRNKPCKDFKDLAILLMPDDTKRLLGTELMEPVLLRVPPASLSDLNRYGNDLRQCNSHFSAVVTRVMFDPQQSHPQMVFTFQQNLTQDEAPTIREMRGNPVALRITGEDITPEARRLRHSEAVQQAPASALAPRPPVTIDQPPPNVGPRLNVPHPNQIGHFQPQPAPMPAPVAAPRLTGFARGGNGHAPAPQTGPVQAPDMPTFLRRAPGNVPQSAAEFTVPAQAAAQPEETTVVQADAAIDAAIGDIIAKMKK